VAVPEVLFKDVAQDFVACPTWRLLLLIVRPGWAHVAALLLPRAARALQASTSTSIVVLHHAGGGLHPLLRDVRGGAAISASVPVVPRVAPSEQAAALPRRLLLLAPDEGSFQVHRHPQPR
jgi:hypothetical protein